MSFQQLLYQRQRQGISSAADTSCLGGFASSWAYRINIMKYVIVVLGSLQQKHASVQKSSSVEMQFSSLLYDKDISLPPLCLHIAL